MKQKIFFIVWILCVVAIDACNQPTPEFHQQNTLVANAVLPMFPHDTMRKVVYSDTISKEIEKSRKELAVLEQLVSRIHKEEEQERAHVSTQKLLEQRKENELHSLVSLDDSMQVWSDEGSDRAITSPLKFYFTSFESDTPEIIASGQGIDREEELQQDSCEADHSDQPISQKEPENYCDEDTTILRDTMVVQKIDTNAGRAEEKVENITSKRDSLKSSLTIVKHEYNEERSEIKFLKLLHQKDGKKEIQRRAAHMKQLKKQIHEIKLQKRRSVTNTSHGELDKGINTC